MNGWQSFFLFFFIFSPRVEFPYFAGTVQYSIYIYMYRVEARIDRFAGLAIRGLFSPANQMNPTVCTYSTSVSFNFQFLVVVVVCELMVFSC